LTTKRWVESELVYGQQILLTSFFNLVLTYNAGAAFSFLSNEYPIQLQSDREVKRLEDRSKD